MTKTDVLIKKRLLVAPLNWGLGHATRCIPLIQELIAHDFEPVIASDGKALSLLKKEFPHLEAIELPSYRIMYPKKGQHFKLKLLQSSPKMLKAIKSERKAIAHIVTSHKIDGIISDNRLGVHSKKVPCVFMTHQLQVLSGNTTWLSTKLHQKVIKRFQECWVPDHLGEDNLSGILGHTAFYDLPVKYIGPLSRFKKEELPSKYDILILLSGPEPQRSLLESKLLETFKLFQGKVLFIRGVVEEKVQCSKEGHLTIYNFMTSEELGKAINESHLIISRSGYTTIMDLAKLNKKAFFIPTPGQFEQEYLAERLSHLGIAPSCSQDQFSLDKLNDIDHYKGLNTLDYKVNYKRLFRLFKGK